MPLLVTSIAAKGLDELKARAERAWAGGADAVEVRIDAFTDDGSAVAAYLKAQRDRTWIVTCRGAEEGGHFRGGLRERVGRLRLASSGTDAYVDFEFAGWQESQAVREQIRAASAGWEPAGHRLILSVHEFSGRRASTAGDAVGPVKGSRAAALLEHLNHLPAGTVGKVAYEANHICDSFKALDWMHRHGRSVIAVAMGEEGLWTRVLAKKLGAFATYCAFDAGMATAPGQPTLHDMVHRYRWHDLDSSTQVFGVIGDPVAHSMSPLLFNRWFGEAGIPAVYLPLRVGRNGDSLRRFLDGCRDRPWLDIGGFSVTTPHKTAALQWAADGADRTAQRIGATNTLVFRKGKVRAFNTDGPAAIASLRDALGGSRRALSGLPVDVLGTGGAARALVYGLIEAGCDVTVYGRSTEAAARLTADLGGRAARWEDRTRRSGTVLVNCTSVGIPPQADRSPMPADALSGCHLVFDLIYHPRATPLLQDAARAGVRTLSGLDMFVRQASTQFELWTGQEPDTRRAYEVLTRGAGTGPYHGHSVS